MKPRRLSGRAGRRGFTLVELLVVMSIMGVLLYLAVPASVSMQEANNLSFAGQTICDELGLARQVAAARNQAVEVRFIAPAGTGPLSYRSIQLWGPDPAHPGASVMLGRMATLPEGVAISADATLSPLVSTLVAGSAGTMSLPRGETRSYVSFTVRPTGTVDTANPPDGEAVARQPEYFFTLVPARAAAAAALPSNYVTIQVNPDTASTQVFRP